MQLLALIRRSKAPVREMRTLGLLFVSPIKPTATAPMPMMCLVRKAFFTHEC